MHGEEEAQKSQAAAKALFGGGGDLSNMPTTHIPGTEFGEGLDIVALLQRCQLVSSSSEARRLIKDGGVYLNNQRVASHEQLVTKADFSEGYVPVSYTHLDVYKRQHYCSIFILQRILKSAGFGWKPVSYTHLDVYKRQV